MRRFGEFVVVVAGVGTALILGLAGCAADTTRADAPPPLPSASAPAYDPDHAPLVSAEHRATADAVQRAYRDAVDVFPAAFPLPPGRSFPRYAELPNEDAGVADDVGAVGELDAAYFWRCAWSDRYRIMVDQKKAAAADTALDMLAGWPTIPSVHEHVEFGGPTEWQDQVIAPARAGDDTVLQRMDGSDCAFFLDATAPKP
jgi:hypothetical protein